MRVNRLINELGLTYRTAEAAGWGQGIVEQPPVAGDVSGFDSGVKVATPNGWRPTEALSVGDIVLTLNGGWQPIRTIVRGALWQGKHDIPRTLWPLEVPAGLFGNRDTFLLLPEQNVLFEELEVMELFGCFDAMIPARYLEGAFGIRRVPPTELTQLVRLEFDHDEFVIAAGGAPIHCPAVSGLQPLSDAEAEARDSDPEATCPVLSRDQSERLLGRLMISDTTCFGYLPEEAYAASV